MNAKVEGYFRFNGTSKDLEGFLTDLSDVFVEHGFGNDMAAADDDIVTSMIVLKESGANDAPDAEEWLAQATDGAAVLVVPMNKPEEKESE